VLHIAGRRDAGDLTSPGPHYDLREYLVPFGRALAAADLAVARAGGSIFELAQHGIPAVLVPYPHATGITSRQRALDARRRRGGRPCRTRSSRPSACAPRPTPSSSTRRASRPCRRRPAASLAPDAAAEVAREVLAAVRGGG
jgi:UDP-N-acetylglucosamine--N-acetylmuramyl-(pentapeptide) pyrophosphoryl-undecaprenol N-acetylglucosamine transferase